MNELVSRLLELARTEEHAFRVTFSKIRVDEVLWQAKASVQQKNPGYKVHIHYDNIPDDEEQLKRYGDESLLKTAFMNLMDNACKYSPAGGLVEVGSCGGANGHIFFVRDHGIGFEMKYAERIFRPFWTHDGKGTGLGLAIARELAVALGGTIDLESEVGRGSRFQLVLPAQN